MTDATAQAAHGNLDFLHCQQVHTRVEIGSRQHTTLWPKHRILIVEDEQDIAGLIKHTLERSDSEAESSEAATPR